MGKVYWDDFDGDPIPPDDQLNEAIRILNSLDWNITLQQDNGEWILFGGDSPIFTAATEQELHTFLFGMAFGLRVLPQEVLDHIRKIIGME